MSVCQWVSACITLHQRVHCATLEAARSSALDSLCHLSLAMPAIKCVLMDGPCLRWDVCCRLQPSCDWFWQLTDEWSWVSGCLCCMGVCLQCGALESVLSSTRDGLALEVELHPLRGVELNLSDLRRSAAAREHGEHERDG